jgi:hypothetical protein
MKAPIVIIGIGEMAGVFARGFLRLGHPVFPVTRQTDPAQAAAEWPEPEAVLVAVAEADLHPALDHLPAAWRDRVILLQNELLPRDWARHALEPTVISVWFEKKPGQDFKVLVPSPAFGRHAQLLHDALGALGIPVTVLEDPDDLLFELVRKNLYIVTTNVAGLEVGGTVAELRSRHQVLMQEVAHDVLAIQESLTGARLPWERLVEAMEAAFDGDPEHKCMGRSAPARLARALAQADAAGLAVPTLRRIRERTGQG